MKQIISDKYLKKDMYLQKKDSTLLMITITTILVPNTGAPAVPNNGDKIIIIEKRTPFTNCVSEINKFQVGNSMDTDVVMSMYNLMEYSDTYLKTSGSL